MALAVPAASVFREQMSRPTLAMALWGLVVCWAAGILWISSLTPAELPPMLFEFTFADKLVHFLAFVVGGWLAAGAFQATGRPRGTAAQIIAAIALTAVFGAFDEASQLLTPGRSGGDVYDWIADFLGAIAGAIIAIKTHAHLERLVTRR